MYSSIEDINMEKLRQSLQILFNDLKNSLKNVWNKYKSHFFTFFYLSGESQQSNSLLDSQKQDKIDGKFFINNNSFI